jgi:hypothetical protein
VIFQRGMHAAAIVSRNLVTSYTVPTFSDW